MRKAGDVCFAEVTRDSEGALVYTFLAVLAFVVMSSIFFSYIFDNYDQELMVLLTTPIMMT